MRPFVKWAGGKTQLLSDIRPNIPSSYGRYYEPFVGGGAVFLDEMPQHATISDANPQLINAYISIRDDLMSLTERLDDLDDVSEYTDTYYYDIRDRYNDMISNDVCSTESTAYMIWLNHHCFNGLYRTNRKGLFNTPWNRSKKQKDSYDMDNLRQISYYLQTNDIRIKCEDYSEVLKEPQKDDFVFLDPPYVPVGKYGDFRRYTKEQFYEEDQEELSECIRDLVGKGVNICLTNSNTDLVKKLYDGFHYTVVSSHRNINSIGNGRYGEDAIITA